MALSLADALAHVGKSAVIINADSMQVYRDIPIVSAAPSKEEREACPHRLYLEWDGAVACSAADWANRAKVEIAAAHQAGSVPILVGGTGMYIRTLLDGIAPIPSIDPAIREEVRALPTAEAYAELAQADPDRAARLDPGDSQRIARALEVVRSTGKTLGEWQSRKEGGIGGEIDLHPLILLPEREWLYERCDRRFLEMLDRGAVEEIEALLARDLSPDLPVMRAIGVPEIAAMIRGELSHEDAIAAGQQSTRNYAKRQYTWFRRQPPEDWARNESQDCQIDTEFARLLQS